MTLRILTVAAAALLLLPAALFSANDASKSDKDLEGSWAKISAVTNGENVPARPGEVEVTIQGNVLTIKYPGGTQQDTSKVDASKALKRIDMTGSKKDQGGRTLFGIYEIMGDELRICVGEPNKDRPTEFSSKEGSGWTLTTYKHVKK